VSVAVPKQFILARNSDLNGVVKSVKQMEDRFNKKFGYPYVFLNEQPFEENFIKSVLSFVSIVLFLTSSRSRVRELTDSSVEFGLIPKEHWYQPDWIDEEKASESRKKMAENNVIYGGQSITFHRT
jgi:alpha 1,2-mannosyltransferase